MRASFLLGFFSVLRSAGNESSRYQRKQEDSRPIAWHSVSRVRPYSLS